MSGLDIEGLMPFYLDETDEQIAGLNEMLLGLERTPGDEKLLREAFRMVHSIKGSSTVMGFVQVKDLTHHLETFFDQIRDGRRALDRPFLDLCFRCLGALRDYHADLRSRGQSDADLTGLTALVVARLEGGEEPPFVVPPSTRSSRCGTTGSTGSTAAGRSRSAAGSSPWSASASSSARPGN